MGKMYQKQAISGEQFHKSMQGSPSKFLPSLPLPQMETALKVEVKAFGYT